MKKNNLQKGFTLVELILAMSLYSIILVLLMSIFASIIEVKLSSEGSSNVEQDGKYILSRMIYDFSQATTITTPANRGDQTSTLQFSDGATTYTYAVAGGNLTLTNGPDTQMLNGFNSMISNLSFTRIGNSSGKPTIKVSFRLTSRTSIGNVAQTRDFNTTLGLR